GGIGGHPEDLMHMYRTVDRLFEDYRWSILGAGKNQQPLATMGATMGSHIRVGLEDSLWIGPGRLADSNAAHVLKMRNIVEELVMEVANHDEAPEMFDLKGVEQIEF